MTFRRPKLSIGVPVYNGEKYLARALDSLLGQSFADFELIISDNGSEDGTGQICEEYQRRDERVSVLRRHQNVGAARNFSGLFEMSAGEYFMWAAVDDTWEKDYVGSCLEVLESDPCAALAYTVTNFVNPDGMSVETYKDSFTVTEENAAQRYLTLIANLDWCNSFYGVIRSSALSGTGLLQENVGAGDCLLLAELALQGKFIQVDKPLFNRNKPAYRETFEQRMTRIEKSDNPLVHNRGITLPFCSWIKAHVDVIRHSILPDDHKNALIRETYRCFLLRWSAQIDSEVDRAIFLVNKGLFQHNWGQALESQAAPRREAFLQKAYVIDLLAMMDYVQFLLPKKSGVNYARSILLITLGRTDEARLALNTEIKMSPSLAVARNLLDQLDEHERQLAQGGSQGSANAL